MYITDKNGKKYAAVERVCIDCGEKKIIQKASFRERCRACSFKQRPNTIQEGEQFVITRGKKNRTVKFTCRACGESQLVISIELKRNKSGMCKKCVNKEQKGCAWVPGFVKQQRKSKCLGKEHQAYRTGLGIYQRLCNKSKGCSCCGYMNNIHAHHVDGDRKNNELENLLPLCASCHKMLHIRLKKGLSHETALNEIQEKKYCKKEV